LIDRQEGSKEEMESCPDGGCWEREEAEAGDDDDDDDDAEREGLWEGGFRANLI
jgi:hypothetical protein